MLKAGITITLVHQHDAAFTAKLDTIIQQGNAMANSLDALKAEVAANKSITASAVALLKGLKDALDAAIASGDPAQIQALADSLGQSDASLAAAIVANTPPTGGGGTPIALPNATLGQAYSASLDPIPGTAPFINTLGAGAPSWLVADATAPLLSGTPDQIGDFAFSWTSTDSDPGSPDVTRNYTLSVV
jgi:hypothetical protein